MARKARKRPARSSVPPRAALAACDDRSRRRELARARNSSHLASPMTAGLARPAARRAWRERLEPGRRVRRRALEPRDRARAPRPRSALRHRRWRPSLSRSPLSAPRAAAPSSASACRAPRVLALDLVALAPSALRPRLPPRRAQPSAASGSRSTRVERGTARRRAATPFAADQASDLVRAPRASASVRAPSPFARPIDRGDRRARDVKSLDHRVEHRLRRRRGPDARDCRAGRAAARERKRRQLDRRAGQQRHDLAVVVGENAGLLAPARRPRRRRAESIR